MSARPDTLAPPNEWLPIAELGKKLGYAPRTVRKKMRDGTWRKGEHWFKRQGCRPLFWWPAIVAWLKADDAPPSQHGAAFGDDIPPARRGRPQSPLAFVPVQK